MNDLNVATTQYYVRGEWFARSETPTQIADRLRQYVDRLGAVHPMLYDPIQFGKKKIDLRFSQMGDTLPSRIAERVARDVGGPSVKEGYFVSAYFDRKPQHFELYGKVGRDLCSPDMNHLTFKTEYDTVPDMSVITYALYRALVLATVECWDPLMCYAQPDTLLDFIPADFFVGTWIGYVPPKFVHLVEPDGVPIIETTPDGGLLMSATSDVFDSTNPAHLAAARRITHATRRVKEQMPTAGDYST